MSVILKKQFVNILIIIFMGIGILDCYANSLEKEEKAIMQTIRAYIEEQNRLLTELDENVQTLNKFYATSLQGQKNLEYEKFLLSVKIGQRILQNIDLRGKNTLLKEKDWHFKKVGKNQIETSFCLDQKVYYPALNITSLEYNQKQIFTVIKENNKWKIVAHEYEDEFKALFDKYKGVYTAKDYARLRDAYLLQVKQQINRQIDKQSNKEELLKEVTQFYRIESNVGFYNREKAVTYAKKYALIPHSPPWGNYEKMGGDCTNFVSQCLFAGEIPFDMQGKSDIEKWYWFSDKMRVPTWTSANAFKIYLRINKKGGIKASLSDFENMFIGDVVQLGDEKETRHSMIIVDEIKDENGKVIDLVIAQHSIQQEGRGYNIPLSTKPIDRLYWHIEGYYK